MRKKRFGLKWILLLVMVAFATLNPVYIPVAKAAKATKVPAKEKATEVTAQVIALVSHSTSHLHIQVKASDIFLIQLPYHLPVYTRNFIQQWYQPSALLARETLLHRSVRATPPNAP